MEISYKSDVRWVIQVRLDDINLLRVRKTQMHLSETLLKSLSEAFKEVFPWEVSERLSRAF